MVNLGEGQLLPAFFVDIMKVSFIGFSGGATAGEAGLDDQGYPTRAFTGTVIRTFSSGATYVGNYTFVWGAGTQLRITNNGGGNSNCVVSGTGGSFTGCSGANVTLTTDGTGAGSMSFDNLTGFSLQFPGTGTYGAANTANLALMRTSDVPAYVAGLGATKWFSPEFIAQNVGLNPKTLRTMGWTSGSSIGGQITNVVKWADASKLTDLSWVGFRYPMKYWSGGIGTAGAITRAASGTCNGSGAAELYTASATSNDPSPSGTPAYGTTIQGINSAANTTTSPLLCWGTTVFPIWNARFSRAPTTSGSEAIAAGIATYIFETKLGTAGVWLYFNGGLTSQPPVNAQTLLANAVNANLQPIIPYLAADDYITGWATAALNLNPGLYFDPEYCNEVWNTQFSCKWYAEAIGQSWGLSSSGKQDVHSWYGLRGVIQAQALIAPVWSGRNYRHVLAYQGGESNANNTTFRFQGFDLNTTIGNQKYCEYTGGTWSGSCSGGQNYDTTPNRPIDKADIIGFAPYAGGANLMFGADICLACTPTALNAPFYQSLVTAWEGGITATSRSLIDSDVRSGRTGLLTVTCSTDTWTTASPHGYTTASNVGFTVAGGTSYGNLIDGAVYRLNTLGASTFKIQAFVNGEPSGSNVTCGTAASGTVTVGQIAATGGSNIQTMQVLNSNWYKSGQYFAGALYASRPVGKSAIRVELYEGNEEVVGPSFAQCNGLGVTSSAPVTNFTATYTSGSNVLSAVTNISNLIKGMTIAGSGIVGGQTILNINPTASTAQLSAVTTGAGTVSALTATDDCSTSMAKAIYDWRKNSPEARATQTTYYNQFMGRDSAYASTYNLMDNSKVPSALVLTSTAQDSNNAASNTYSLVDGPFPNSAPFQWYYGFADFVGVQ